MDYKELTNFYIDVSKTSKRLKKTYITSEFLKKVSPKDLKQVVYLMQGKVFPDFSQDKVGVSSKLIIKALSTTTAKSAKEIESSWKKIGDLGETAKKLLKNKSQKTLFSSKLTVQKVFDNIQKIASFQGKGTVSKKVGLMSELLSSATPKESVFIVRTLIGDLRVGIASGILKDSITWAFLDLGIFKKCPHCKKPVFPKSPCAACQKDFKLDLDSEKRKEYNDILDIVQRAYDLTNDFAKVAITAKKSKVTGLLEITPTIGVPVRSMEAIKQPDIESTLEDIEDELLIERKYDGYKIQIHKKGDKIWLFTRRQEEVTKAFPELVKSSKKDLNCKSCIVEGECVAFDPKTNKSLPFQNVSKRIKRKYDIEKISKKIPVKIMLFDIIYKDKKSLINKEIVKRREILEKTVNKNSKNLKLSEQIKTRDKEKIDEFYKKSLKDGFEGIMVKNPKALYKPGRYVGYQYKLKPVLENLDLVIIGAEWGTGKRAGWLSSFNIACKDKDEFLACGKLGTGIKEKSKGVTFKEMTKLLKPLIIKESGRSVKLKPEVVIEVSYEEIQKSPNYESGFALRFPRLIRIREDKKPQDSNSLKDIKRVFSFQKGKK